MFAAKNALLFHFDQVASVSVCNYQVVRSALLNHDGLDAPDSSLVPGHSQYPDHVPLPLGWGCVRV